MANPITLDDLHKFGQQLRKDIVDDLITYSNKTYATKDEIAEIKESIKFLPNSDQFFTKMDEYVAELKDARREKSLHTEKHQETDDTLEKHDTRLFALESTINPI